MRPALVAAALLLLALGGGFYLWKEGSAPIVSEPLPVATSTPSTPAATSTPPVVSTPTSTPPIVVTPTTTPTNWTEIVWADRSKKQVVFTFDGGAGSHSIDEIIATLKKHGVTGTFFVTGKWAEQNATSTRRLAAEGHEVFNHTYDHSDLTTLSSAQITSQFARAESSISALTGKTTKPYFRPPYGARNAAVLAAARQAGYRSVYWTVDALDWKPGITDQEVRTRILSNLAPGTIYMMHIGDDITGRILDDMLTEIKARGYAIVPLTKAL
ncbi:MAG TPA: polysaccharide deacetylase family protein [Candidatus Paceibacterota bacterium]|nr:polysaccharide deacetylase family protein [Candidatus Paceibacterota bacterium]